MLKSDLEAIDLNLLKLLDALARERSVTAAGQALGLSQPAASRMLARLRALLGDRLVVRTAQGLRLTPRAEALAGPVAALLDQARAIVTPPAFDPATTRAVVRIGSFDYQSLVLVPALVERLTARAPGMDVEIVASDGDLEALLASGGVDMVLGRAEAPFASMQQRVLFGDDMVCLLRNDHPALDGPDGLSLERYTALRHVLITTTGRGVSMVDECLASVGLRRRVGLRLPHFLAAPLIVAESDLLLTAPRLLARRFVAMAPLRLVEPPPPVAGLGFTISLLWHARHQDDPAHAWLRRQIAAAAAAIAAPPSLT